MLNSQPSIVDSQDDYAFLARSNNVPLLVDTLQCVNVGKGIWFELNDSGLRVVVEASTALQARAFFPKENFTDFKVKSEVDEDGNDVFPRFYVELATLLDCLSIFGNSPLVAMRMAYEGYGCPLILMLEEDGVIADCSIKTLIADEVEEMRIDGDGSTPVNIPNVIMQSAWLASAFSELDSSSDCVEFYISPDAPNFRMATSGDAGVSEIVCPKASEVVESFECTSSVVARYRMKTLKVCEKPLNKSSKVSVRIGQEGMLAMQFLVIQEDSENVFIEHICLAEQDA